MTHPYFRSHAERQARAQEVVKDTGYKRVGEVKDGAPKSTKEREVPRETKNNVEKDLL